MSDDVTKARLRRLVILAAIGLTVIGIGAAVLLLTGTKLGVWPIIAGDLVLTLIILGLAWRALH